jgi:hypothetical protein
MKKTILVFALVLLATGTAFAGDGSSKSPWTLQEADAFAVANQNGFWHKADGSQIHMRFPRDKYIEVLGDIIEFIDYGSTVIDHDTAKPKVGSKKVYRLKGGRVESRGGKKIADLLATPVPSSPSAIDKLRGQADTVSADQTDRGAAPIDDKTILVPVVDEKGNVIAMMAISKDQAVQPHPTPAPTPVDAPTPAITNAPAKIQELQSMAQIAPLEAWIVTNGGECWHAEGLREMSFIVPKNRKVASVDTDENKRAKPSASVTITEGGGISIWFTRGFSKGKLPF